MSFEEGPEWDEVCEVAARLFNTEAARISIEVDRGTVFVNFQESMTAPGFIRSAVKAAVKAVLPKEHAELDVSVV